MSIPALASLVTVITAVTLVNGQSFLLDRFRNAILPKGFARLESVNTLLDTVPLTTACLMNSGFEDPFIGKMTLNASVYCDPRCLRFIPGVSCCSPQSPSELNVRLLLFKPDGYSEEISWKDPTERFKFEDEKIVFLIHGYMEKVNSSPTILPIKDAWIARGRTVIVVDWRYGNQVHYFQTVANTRTIGAMLGHAIVSWKVASRTLMVGFSAGAQMIGETARYVKMRGELIDECTGLDPAGPGYDNCHEDIRLDKSDCRLVQVIHSSAGQTPTGLTNSLRMLFGTYHKSGHCDYWVNCGQGQGPLCKDIQPWQFIKAVGQMASRLNDEEMMKWISKQTCSHFRAAFVYLSMLDGSCNYHSEVCRNCGGLLGKFCKGNATLGVNSVPPDSVCSPREDSNYNLVTGDYTPYCNPN